MLKSSQTLGQLLKQDEECFCLLIMRKELKAVKMFSIIYKR